MNTEIEQALAPLIGQPLWGPARAENMLSLQAGASRAAPVPASPERRTGSFVLQVYCPWRLTREHEILAGAGDLLTPTDPEAELEEFDWEQPGSTWWDLRMDAVFREASPEGITIESIVVDRVGGFALHCAGGFVLDVFPNSSRAEHVETEFWRLVRPGSAEAHVVFDTSGLHRELEG